MALGILPSDIYDIYIYVIVTIQQPVQIDGLFYETGRLVNIFFSKNHLF